MIINSLGFFHTAIFCCELSSQVCSILAKIQKEREGADMCMCITNYPFGIYRTLNVYVSFLMQSSSLPLFSFLFCVFFLFFKRTMKEMLPKTLKMRAFFISHSSNCSSISFSQSLPMKGTSRIGSKFCVHFFSTLIEI